MGIDMKTRQIIPMLESNEKEDTQTFLTKTKRKHEGERQPPWRHVAFSDSEQLNL